MIQLNQIFSIVLFLINLTKHIYVTIRRYITTYLASRFTFSDFIEYFIIATIIRVYRFPQVFNLHTGYHLLDESGITFLLIYALSGILLVQTFDKVFVKLSEVFMDNRLKFILLTIPLEIEVAVFFFNNGAIDESGVRVFLIATTH